MYYNVYIGYTLSRVACVRVYFINTKFNNVSDATKLLLCTVHRRVERREICNAKYQPIVLNSSHYCHHYLCSDILGISIII